MMRTLVATMTLTLGGYLTLCPVAAADQTSADIIFTGVVPPACAVTLPTDGTPSEPDTLLQNSSSRNSSVAVLCNDGVQVNSDEYIGFDQSATSQQPATVETTSQEFITITLP